MTGALVSLMLIVSISPNFVDAQEKFKSKLTGKNEVPPVNTTAVGKLNLKVRDNAITTRINISSVPDVKEAHIHQGNASENGDVIVDLLKTSDIKDKSADVVLRGSISDSDLLGPMKGKTIQDLQAAMASGNTYADVHTGDNPDGLVRGEIKISGNATETATMNGTETATMNATQTDTEEE